jgi:hypothetical protein
LVKPMGWTSAMCGVSWSGSVSTSSSPPCAHAAVRTRTAAGMIKRYPEDDYEVGWIDIVCPWTDEHTDGADTGAAVRPPAPENEYTGAFRCHHSHGGRIKRWHDLTDWIADNHEFALDNANKNAKEFEDYEC